MTSFGRRSNLYIYKEKTEELKNASDFDHELHLSYLKFSLSKYPIFRILDEVSIKKMQSQMKYVKLAQDKDEGYIFRQNDEPENFYVVVQGTLVVEIDGVERNRLIAGDSFGEIALTENILRTASVRQLNFSEDVILLALCWKIFEGYKRNFFTKL